MANLNYRDPSWDLRRVVALPDGSMFTEDGQQVNGIPNGTTTLAAGSSTVAASGVTAGPIVRLTVLAAAGTPGGLTVTATPGVGFTITSTSGTDTSQVFWEILKY